MQDDKKHDKKHDKTTSEASNDRAPSGEGRPIGLTGNRAEAAHTPGPWRTGRKVHRTIYCEEHGTEGRLIGVMDRAEDATLSAAGPDMVEALRDARSVITAADHSKAWQSERSRCLARLDAVIATAEGREP